MMLISHIVAFFLLGILGVLAFLAFSGYTNPCTDDAGNPDYPCAVQPLFNENFLGIPFVGPFVNFYPMLNVAAVPILTITLRNNIMEVVPIKRWLLAIHCPPIILDVIT